MPLKLLTPREMKVLQLLSTGKTNKKIAVDMYVTEKTVEYHLDNLYTKAGVKTRVAAVMWGVRHGLQVE